MWWLMVVASAAALNALKSMLPTQSRAAKKSQLFCVELVYRRHEERNNCYFDCLFVYGLFVNVLMCVQE